MVMYYNKQTFVQDGFEEDMFKKRLAFFEYPMYTTDSQQYWYDVNINQAITKDSYFFGPFLNTTYATIEPYVTKTLKANEGALPTHTIVM